MSAQISPEPAPAELSPANAATLQQLVRTIDYAEGLTLLFAKCNIPTLRRALAQAAIQQLAARGIDVVEVEFSEEISDLRRHLRDRLAGLAGPEGKTAVFLYGLEHAIPSRDPEPPLLTELNMGRELFHQDAPHPLVFWLPDYALTALARGAPDFWSWRSGVFDFEAEHTHREEALQVYAREGARWLVIDNLTAEQKRRRRSVLENLLADYAALEQDQRTLSERAEVLFTLGQLNQALGEYSNAREFYQRSLKTDEKLGDQAGIAASLHQLGIIAQDQGNYDDARRLYQQSLEILEKLGNQAGIASGLHQLGRIAAEQGEYAEARRLFQQDLELAEMLEDEAGLAVTVWNLGNIALDQGDIAEAERQYEEALSVFQKLGDKKNAAGVLHQLGMIAQEQGDYADARRLYGESLEIEEKLGNQAGVASSLHQLGTIAQEQGDYDDARRLYQQSLEIFERLKSHSAETARRNLERLEAEMLTSNQPIRAAGE